MGHPGRNNSLFTNALDPVAVLYNDRAVLENYHSCLTFKVLEKPECDIFAGLKTRVSFLKPSKTGRRRLGLVG